MFSEVARFAVSACRPTIQTAAVDKSTCRRRSLLVTPLPAFKVLACWT